jgi:acetylornithine/N-succinyldiaminopimelate aminotransferase
MNSYCDTLMDVTARPPVTMVSGQGSWLIDNHDRRYLDFVQGWAVNCLGHSPVAIAEAIAAQASTLLSCSPAFYNVPMMQLANKLAFYSGLHKVFFACSGAEANEGAIKLARKWGSLNRAGAFEIITLQNSFHGRTLAAMSASGKPQWQDLFEPKVPGFPKVPINDIAAIEAAITSNTVAVMLEPVQGEAGVIAASVEYLQALRALTRAHGILLILDEIQTGIGRTGTLFAYQRANILPDILTLGKGLGGGVPLAALLARADVSCFDYGDQGGTFTGNPLTTAAGCAVLEVVMQPGFLDNVCANGNYFRERLSELSRCLSLGAVRGDGLLLALEIPANDATTIAAKAFEYGLLINAPRDNILRFMPALTVTQAEIDQAIALLQAVILASKNPL